MKTKQFLKLIPLLGIALTTSALSAQVLQLGAEVKIVTEGDSGRNPGGSPWMRLICNPSQPAPNGRDTLATVFFDDYQGADVAVVLEGRYDVAGLRYGMTLNYGDGVELRDKKTGKFFSMSKDFIPGSNPGLWTTQWVTGIPSNTSTDTCVFIVSAVDETTGLAVTRTGPVREGDPICLRPKSDMSQYVCTKPWLVGNHDQRWEHVPLISNTDFIKSLTQSPVGGSIWRIYRTSTAIGSVQAATQPSTAGNTSVDSNTLRLGHSATFDNVAHPGMRIWGDPSKQSPWTTLVWRNTNPNAQVITIEGDPRTPGLAYDQAIIAGQTPVTLRCADGRYLAATPAFVPQSNPGLWGVSLVDNQNDATPFILTVSDGSSRPIQSGEAVSMQPTRDRKQNLSGIYPVVPGLDVWFLVQVSNLAGLKSGENKWIITRTDAVQAPVQVAQQPVATPQPAPTMPVYGWPTRSYPMSPMAGGYQQQDSNTQPAQQPQPVYQQPPAQETRRRR